MIIIIPSKFKFSGEYPPTFPKYYCHVDYEAHKEYIKNLDWKKIIFYKLTKPNRNSSYCSGEFGCSFYFCIVRYYMQFITIGMNNYCKYYTYAWGEENKK